MRTDQTNIKIIEYGKHHFRVLCYTKPWYDWKYRWRDTGLSWEFLGYAEQWVAQWQLEFEQSRIVYPITHWEGTLEGQNILDERAKCK